MAAVKVATCCYCGTKAALVLRGKSRHELTCGQCGAPLRRMKMLKTQPEQATAHAATPARPNHRTRPAAARPAQPRKPRRRKSLFQKVVSEIWDEIEDIFD
ncbi:hypothetical protein [Yoonia sediminilitoris]|uniref:Uncharacterized protein n=1 Tax=Yoonia sediminilitoris TaxID=1286148 RepID=A0A2T6KEV6_9RHOB|nr:hypothetical protein [Yoonia sediminilitoris]PUB13627.1 hypothetical protein C8N45_10787 [Yoonia sediminilitoris]RCW94797.1 hypothetical protein DFP92_10787 [Yoonia sediminilitoris]